MKSRFSCFAIAVLLSVARAATPPPPPDRPITPKEMRQGFSDRVLLARPRAARMASADAEEVRDGVRVREKFARLRGLRVIALDAGDTADAAIARLRATGRYDFVEPDYVRHATAEPNDPQFLNGALWALKNTGQSAGVSGADIKATQAWDIIHDAPNVVVAVIDTGVNLNHQDIAANLWTNPAPTFGDLHGARFINGGQSGDPTDDNGHGTHVAGTIGAVGNNGLGSTGIAWTVRIMAVKSLGSRGSGFVSDIARGVNYALAHGAGIINASYGESGSNGFSNTELAALTAARDAGVIFVAAAGNDGANMDVTRHYPASHALDNIVTVGASTRRDELATYSNYGGAVDLFAPGEEIVSLNYANDTGTISYSGTSMAAPQVAGALALLAAQFPADTYRQRLNRLLRGVDAGPRFAGKAGTGGRLNLFRAVTGTDARGNPDPNANRPFNDDFARRPRFTSDNLALRASNAGATAEAGEPAHAGSPPTASLWWEWTAPATGIVSVDTSGSGYDTVLAVYTGASPGALTPVASNDDEPGGATSRVSFSAQAGTTYEIAVDGKNGGTGLTLLNLGTTPANDAFAAAVALQGESLHLSATNAHCSREAGEPRIGSFAGGTSLWYRWTAPRTAHFQVAAASTDFDPILAVYTGTSLDALTPVEAALNAAANDKSNGALWSIDATAGATYWITVDTKDARAAGQFTLSLTDSRWQARVGDAITGAPAMGADGTVYFGSLDGSLYAFAADGKLKWSYATGALIDTCSPAVADDGTVYVGSADGRLYAFTSAGALKWTHDFGGIPVGNSPALAADGTIYLKAGDGYLYALSPVDGATKWRFDVHAPTSYASPAVAADGTVYQGSEDKNLYAINSDGSQKWVFAGDNDIYTVPAIDAAGNLYFGVLNTGKLFSVGADGKKRWEYSGARLGSSSSPCLSPDGGTVYFGGYDAKLHAVNAATGAARWTFALGSEVRASSPAVDADGVVYLGCYDAKLYAINPDGTLKRTWDTGDIIRSCPAIFGNTLYLGSNDRKLYAFDLGAASAGGPWPQYRQNPRRTGNARPRGGPATITTSPQSKTVAAGQSVTLGVTAIGDAPLAYQWFKDGALIVGATRSSYTIAEATASAAGSYSVTVTNPLTVSGLTTAPAEVVVTSAPALTEPENRLINLSVRARAGTGGETLILGFVSQGGPVLVRGVGPALTAFDVPNPLADPHLAVFRADGTAVAENDDWDADLAPLATSVGAFALAPGSKDAALVANLPAGNYTAHVTAAGSGASGTAIAEVYDATPAATGITRLINVSARAHVGGGDSLIAGFVVAGSTPKKVLVTAVGPELGNVPFNLAGTLADPQLDLFDGDLRRVASNNDWADGASSPNAYILDAATRAGALLQSASSTSKSAALLLLLPPGSYTAQVSGANDSAGIALVEVYEVP